MMWVALILLAVIAGAVLFVVFAPVDLTFTVAMPGRWAPLLRVRWLYGLVRFERGFGDRVVRPRPAAKTTPDRARPSKGEKPRRPRLAKVRRGGRIARGLWKVEGLGIETVRLLVRLVRAARWRRFTGRLRLGLAEPSETGEVCGIMGPVMVFIPRGRTVDFRFEPDFAGPSFELHARGEMRVIPADVLGALVRYVLTGPVLRGIKVVAWDSRPETS